VGHSRPVTGLLYLFYLVAVPKCSARLNTSLSTANSTAHRDTRQDVRNLKHGCITFSSVVKQIPGHNSPRRGTARTVPMYFCVVLCIVFFCFMYFFLLFYVLVFCRSMYFLWCSMYFLVVLCLFFFCVLFYVLFVFYRSVYCWCVNVYCTTATGCQPNCS
jgi:hypothetical protein